MTKAREYKAANRREGRGRGNILSCGNSAYQLAVNELRITYRLTGCRMKLSRCRLPHEDVNDTASHWSTLIADMTIEISMMEKHLLMTQELNFELWRNPVLGNSLVSFLIEASALPLTGNVNFVDDKSFREVENFLCPSIIL